jgi:hypothetical protein
VLFLIVAFFTVSVGLPQEFTADDAPGPLSSSHTGSPGLLKCLKCHNEDFEVEASRCLACHTEISERIAAERGYHRDKTEDCAVCHTEHLGADTVLVILDPEDFDHDETGTVLKGPHAGIKDCRTCHRADNTIARKKSLSYLFRRTGCRACHVSPHPGAQDECLKCHTQKNWRVSIWRRGGGR